MKSSEVWRGKLLVLLSKRLLGITCVINGLPNGLPKWHVWCYLFDLWMKPIVYKVPGLYAAFKSQIWMWTHSYHLQNCKHMGPAIHEVRPNLGMTSLKNVRCGLFISGRLIRHCNVTTSNIATKSVVYFGYQRPCVWCAHMCKQVWVEHWCLAILTHRPQSNGKVTSRMNWPIRNYTQNWNSI